MEVVLTVWRRRVNSDEGILIAVDRTREVKESVGSLRQYEGPWTMAGGLMGFSGDSHSHCCYFDFWL